MKKLTVVLLILFLAAGVAYAKNYEVKKKAGDYTAQITIDKNPPVVGRNNIEIAIQDKSGKQVTDASVMVEYGMPAMPGMPGMNYRTGTKFKDGTYQATMHISMAGS